jgi:hypothetical protein
VIPLVISRSAASNPFPPLRPRSRPASAGWPNSSTPSTSKPSLTDPYNTVEKLRTGQPLSAKYQIVHQQGLTSVVLRLHQQLDAALADAYT